MRSVHQILINNIQTHHHGGCLKSDIALPRPLHTCTHTHTQKTHTHTLTHTLRKHTHRTCTCVPASRTFPRQTPLHRELRYYGYDVVYRTNSNLSGLLRSLTRPKTVCYAQSLLIRRQQSCHHLLQSDRHSR